VQPFGLAADAKAGLVQMLNFGLIHTRATTAPAGYRA
jgi:hypothetical protein